MPPSPAPSDFAPKRAALHAGLTAVVAIVALAVVAAVSDVKDPYRLGQSAGMFVAFLAALAFGISWLAQTGRRRAAWIVGASFAVLVAAAIVVTVTSGPRRWVTEADRAPLTTRGEGADARLVNATLGFSLSAPGDGFAPSSQVAGMFGKDPDRPTWGWLDGVRGAALVVTIEPELGPDAPPARVEEFLSGMVDGIHLTAAEREVAWTGADPTFRVEGSVAGQRVRVSGHGARLGAERHPAAVIVMSIGDGERALDPVFDSLVVPR